jgi:hypothetical protein
MAMEGNLTVLHDVAACKRVEMPWFVLIDQFIALNDGAPIDYQHKDKHPTHNDIIIYLSGKEIQYRIVR